MTDTIIAQLSDQLAGAVEHAGRSTLLVNARRRLPASGIAWTENAILTSDHVLEREDNITVQLEGGRELTATIAGRDPGSDLALLKVEAGLQPIERAPEGSARVGSMVLALGRPSDEGIQASFGVIGSVGGPWRTFRGTQVGGYLRSDTTFFPGFSGGPLIDVQGRAVGINSSRLGRGAGITLPIAAAAGIADDLLSRGRVRRAYLGMSSQQVRLPEAFAARPGGRETGLLVVMVEAGSPADQAGLLLGDIVVALAGKPTGDTESLQGLLGPERIGQSTTLTLFRGGEPRDLQIVPGER